MQMRNGARPADGTGGPTNRGPLRTRRHLLADAAALTAAAAIASISHVVLPLERNQPAQLLRAVRQLARDVVTRDAHIDVAALFPAGYLHGLFTVNTPSDVEHAQALGINCTICYTRASWECADPTTPVGKALLAAGIKTVLDLQGPFLTCSQGVARADLTGARDLVSRLKDSPLLAGYWIKDDDCGDMRDAVSQLRGLVRSIDPNPKHLILAGYSDAASVQRTYVHGQADVLAFYPYPCYSRGPARELPDMLRIVSERTPWWAPKPPFIGIYQAFGTPPRRPVPSQENVIAQVNTYLAHGASGIMGYGWRSDYESHVVANTGALRDCVSSISHLLGQQARKASAGGQ